MVHESRLQLDAYITTTKQKPIEANKKVGKSFRIDGFPNNSLH